MSYLDGNSESDFVQWHGGISDVFLLSDISQTQKDAYCVSPLVWHFGEDRTIGMKTRSVADQGWGGSWQHRAMGQHLGGQQMVPYDDRGGRRRSLYISQRLELYITDYDFPSVQI